MRRRATQVGRRCGCSDGVLKGFAVLLAALLLAFGYRLLISDAGLREVWRLRGELQVQQEENAALRERNSTLEAEVADLREGVEAVEERARVELGMIRKGETKFTIVENDAAAAEQTAAEE